MEQPLRLNHQIKAPELRVVDDQGEFLGIFSLSEALRIASEKELDLIEIAPNANPPVAKIIDYDKFRYQREKELKKQRAQQKTSELKQIRFGARAAKNDMEIKIKQIEKFVSDGHKVEIMLVLKGREKYNKEWAFQRLQEFLAMIPFEYKTIVEPKFGGRGLLTQITKK